MSKPPATIDECVRRVAKAEAYCAGNWWSPAAREALEQARRALERARARDVQGRAQGELSEEEL